VFVNRFQTCLVAGWLSLAWILPALADEPNQTIDELLSLGPVPLSVELFERDAKRSDMRRALLMQMSQAGLPQAGDRVSLFGQALDWRASAPGQAAGDGLGLWAVNLEADRFVRGKLLVTGLKQPRLLHDGRQLEPSDDAFELDLAAGTHALMLLHQGAAEDAEPTLAWSGQAAHDRVRAHIEPRRRVSARLLTNAETVGSMAMSADGRYLALSFSARSDEADLDLRRLEVHDLNDQRIVRQWTTSLPAGRWPGALTAATWPCRRVTISGCMNWPAVRPACCWPITSASAIWRWHPDGGSILFAWTDPWESTITTSGVASVRWKIAGPPSATTASSTRSMWPVV
jgi:hypothetical protein